MFLELSTSQRFALFWQRASSLLPLLPRAHMYPESGPHQWHSLGHEPSAFQGKIETPITHVCPLLKQLGQGPCPSEPPQRDLLGLPCLKFAVLDEALLLRVCRTEVLITAGVGVGLGVSGSGTRSESGQCPGIPGPSPPPREEVRVQNVLWRL